jgi:hypothetical protein
MECALRSWEHPQGTFILSRTGIKIVGREKKEK